MFKGIFDVVASNELKRKLYFWHSKSTIVDGCILLGVNKHTLCCIVCKSLFSYFVFRIDGHFESVSA